MTIGSGAGFNNLDNRDSIIALRKLLTDVNNVILKFSPQVSQRLGGNPVAIKKELESDKGFLKEVASEQQRLLFVKDLTAAMPSIIGLMVSLRQAFNRKNPNNIYKSDIKYSKMDTAGGNPEQRGSDKQNPELEESKIFIKESKNIFKLK